MTKFTGRRKKIQKKKIETVLTNHELLSIKQIKTIQSIDVDNFATMVENIMTEETVILEKKRLHDELQKHFNVFKNLNPEELHGQINNVLFIKELIFNLRKILNNSNIHIDLRTPFFSLLNEFDKKLQHIINQVIEYRKLHDLITSVENENHVANVVFEIYQKFLIYASPDRDTPNENLKQSLDNIIMGIQERMNDEQRSDVITQIDDGNTTVQLPNPIKFFNPNEKSLTNNESSFKISSIKDLYSLFSQLKLRIAQLVNIKRHDNSRIKRGNELEKYPKEQWENLQIKLIEIIDNASILFIKVLLRNFEKLLIDEDKTKLHIRDYFSNPILQIAPKKFIHVHDNILNFMIILRDTYEPSHNDAYAMMIRDLFENLFQILDKLPDNKNIIAKHLLLVRYANTLNDLENKMNVLFTQEKQELVLRLIEFRKSDKSLNELPIMEIENINTEPTQTNSRKLSVNLDKILESMTTRVLSQPSILIEETTDNIDQFFKTYKANTNYEKILIQALKGMRIGWKDKLPLSFYKKYIKTEYKKLFITHFTAFFQGYMSIYGSYPKNIVDSNSTEFGIWLTNRIDGGKFLNEHVKFISSMIDKGYMEYKKQNGLIDFNTNALINHGDEINKLKKPVVNSHIQVIELGNKFKSVITNQPSDNSSEECRHITIQNKLDKLYDEQQLFPNNVIIQDEINQLESDKLSCESITKEAIICKYCGVKMSDNISAEPDRFEDMEEQREINQRLISDTNLQERIRKEQMKENSEITNQYIHNILNLFKITIKNVVSTLDDNSCISVKQTKDLEHSIVQIIKDQDRNIFNYASSFTNKTIRNLNKNSIKSQIVHDLIKYLVIMNIFHIINGKIPNNLCPQQQKTSRIIQCLFAKIQSLRQYIPLTSLNQNTQLNFRRNIFNKAVEIQNNSSRHRFETDDEIITSENIDQDQVIIIAQNFGMPSSVSRSELVRIIENIPNENVENIDYESEPTKKLIENYLSMFGNIIANEQLFTTKSATDLIEHLNLFMNYNQLKDLHQKNQRLTFIKRRIQKIDNRLHEINDNELNEGNTIHETVERDNEKLLLNKELEEIKKILKLKKFTLNEKLLSDYEELIKQLPINMVNDGWNFINLFQYLKYNSRTENIKNKDATKFINHHKDIDLSKLGNNEEIINHLRRLYEFRREYVQERINVLKFLNLLVRVSPYLHDKVSMISHNKKITISSKKGSLSFSEKLVKSLADFLNISMTSVRLFALKNMLNDKDFQNHVHTEVVSYMNERNGVNELKKYQDEMQTYKNIDDFLNQYEHVISLCPICPVTNNRNVIMKIHITSKHQVHSNDKINTVMPYKYNEYMKWVYGKANKKGNFICPYCPMRDDDTGKILGHIRSVHLNLDKSRHAFKNGMKEQYNVHLINLYENYDIVNNVLIKLKNKRLGFDKNIAQKIDILYDEHKIYMSYCDGNVGKVNTKQHKFNNGICIHCNRNIDKIYRDSMRNSPRVNELIKSVEERVKELVKRYCLTSKPQNIHEDVRTKKCKPSIHILKNPQQLLSFEQHWNTMRNLPHMNSVIINNVMNIVDQYFSFYKSYNTQNIELTFDHIDIISNAVHTQNDIDLQPIHDKNFLQELSNPYRNISKKLRKNIFETNSIKKMNKEIITLTKKYKKFSLDKDRIILNKDIQEIKKNIRKEIAKNAEEYLLKQKNYNVNSFVNDIQTYANDENDPSIYTEIIRDLEKRDNDSSFFNNRTNVLKHIPNDLLKYLAMFVNQNKKAYLNTAHFYSL